MHPHLVEQPPKKGTEKSETKNDKIISKRCKKYGNKQG